MYIFMYIVMWRPWKGCGGGCGGSSSTTTTTSSFHDSEPPMVWHYATAAANKSVGIMVQGACIHLSLYKNFSLSFIFFNLSYLFIVNVIDLMRFGHTHTLCYRVSELGVGISLEEFFFSFLSFFLFFSLSLFPPPPPSTFCCVPVC